MLFQTDMPKLTRNKNCKDKWKATKCKRKKDKGQCKEKNVAKKCKRTCEKCCPGYTFPNGDGNCVCPGNTVDYGNGNCSCIDDIVDDSVGNCFCPGGLGTFPFCFPTNGNFLYIKQIICTYAIYGSGTVSHFDPDSY